MRFSKHTHGSISTAAISTYDLRARSKAETYGVATRVGHVRRRTGVPDIGGLLRIGLVVGLDYKISWVKPYRELQRMKHHPHFRALVSTPGAEHVAYGARSFT
ncbi:hypothetical protein DFH09DRAFT_1382953 [Mycena vulgaris]|nr:hypothetical protein DFH09DRAFT_1382953 [Mycena vulgaris]